MPLNLIIKLYSFLLRNRELQKLESMEDERHIKTAQLELEDGQITLDEATLVTSTLQDRGHDRGQHDKGQDKGQDNMERVREEVNTDFAKNNKKQKK